MNSPHTLQINTTHKATNSDNNLWTDRSTNVSLYCTNNSFIKNAEFNEIHPPHIQFISLHSKVPK